MLSLFSRLSQPSSKTHPRIDSGESIAHRRSRVKRDREGETRGKLVLVLVVASMSVLAKCGHSGAGSPSGAAVPQQSSPAVSTTTTTASTSQTTSTSPSQSTPVPASWPTYTSASGGYTIRYPDTWHHLPNLGQPPEQEYFSNEQVASPEQMSPAGVWLTVTASAGSCAPGTPRAWAQKGQQTVHTRFGDVVLVYGDSTATQAEAGSIARTAVSHPRGCATFEFVSKNSDTLQSGLPTAGTIVSSINEP